MNFTKLQATGNDFIFVDARTIERDWPGLAHEMCHRHFGVGADGLILVLNSNKANLRMRLFNLDGSEAELSGNGLRCFAKYAIDRQIAAGPNLTVETMSGVRTIQAILSEGKVVEARVNMGKPGFKPEKIPVLIEKQRDGRGQAGKIPIIDYPLAIGRRSLRLSFVSMGNPHAVCFLSKPVANFPLSVVGPKIENHPMFPERINFEAVRVLGRSNLEARVWERGVGETLSCGSGACAIAVISKIKAYTGTSVDIMLPGGKLTANWDGRGDVYLSGPVDEVFDGEWSE